MAKDYLHLVHFTFSQECKLSLNANVLDIDDLPYKQLINIYHSKTQQKQHINARHITFAVINIAC